MTSTSWGLSQMASVVRPGSCRLLDGTTAPTKHIAAVTIGQVGKRQVSPGCDVGWQADHLRHHTAALTVFTACRGCYPSPVSYSRATGSRPKAGVKGGRA
jgi:hypothetical protein